MKHKVIKKVLMCKPLHFDEVNAVYNPWMQPGKISKQKSIEQWDSLVNAYIKLGITIEQTQTQSGWPDMVFATDQGIVKGKKVLLSNFRPQERKGESGYYEQWFAKNGYTIDKLPPDLYFEGNGECYFWNDIIFIGTGHKSHIRSSREAITYLEKYFTREVIPLYITDPRFYHLDVGFFPLNNETIFYYPYAYTEHTVKKLRKLVPNLIEFTKDEAIGFCANSVVTDHHVIHQKNNITFSSKLHKLGYKTVEVDLSEFKKSGGGAHCLTNILEEAN